MVYSTVYWLFSSWAWAYVIYKYKIWLSLEMIRCSRKKFAKSWIIIEMTKFDAFIHITHITFIYLFIYLLLFLFAHKIFIFIVVFTCWFLFIVFMNNFSIVILRHSLPYIHLLWLDFCILLLNCNKFYHWLAHERKIAFCRKVYCFFYSIWPLFVIFFFSLFHPFSYMFNISVIVIEQYVDEHTDKKKIMAHTRKFIIFIVIIIAIS